MSSRIVVALDGMDFAAALDLAKCLRGQVWGFKTNDLLFDEHGARQICTNLRAYGSVFADPKLHDIPNTVANSVRMLADHGANLITVHASGGVPMMQAAVRAAHERRREDGIGILAVTILTSLDEAECKDTYGGRTPAQAVRYFANNAARAGAFGIVCSPNELLHLGNDFPDLKRVTPGVRSAGADLHDQKRVGTPERAIKDGATLIVVGREITQAPDPVEASRRINLAVASVTD